MKYLNENILSSGTEICSSIDIDHLTENSRAGRIFGENNGQSVGSHQDIVRGDFNNDGKIDTAIVACDENNQMKVYIGFDKSYWDDLNTFNVILTEEPAYYCRIVAGDFNNDSISDIVVSASLMQGRIYLISGSNSLHEQSIVNIIRFPSFNYTKPQFSYNSVFPLVSLVVADVNGDKVDDIIIGNAYRYSNALYVVFGNVNIKNIIMNLKNLYELDGSSGVVFKDPAGSYFGFSISTGDFDNNNISDIVASSLYTDSTSSHNGCIYVFFGATNIRSIYNLPSMLPSEGVRISTKKSNDYLHGWSFSVGNFNGDNYSDLAFTNIYDRFVYFDHSPGTDFVQENIYLFFGREDQRYYLTEIDDCDLVLVSSSFTPYNSSSTRYDLIQLMSLDINNDKKDDLFIVNNTNGKITFILGRDEFSKLNTNDFENDLSIYTNKNLYKIPRIWKIDINDDQRNDLVVQLRSLDADTTKTFVVFGNSPPSIKGSKTISVDLGSERQFKIFPDILVESEENLQMSEIYFLIDYSKFPHGNLELLYRNLGNQENNMDIICQNKNDLIIHNLVKCSGNFSAKDLESYIKNLNILASKKDDLSGIYRSKILVFNGGVCGISSFDQNVFVNDYHEHRAFKGWIIFSSVIAGILLGFAIVKFLSVICQKISNKNKSETKNISSENKTNYGAYNAVNYNGMIFRTSNQKMEGQSIRYIP